MNAVRLLRLRWLQVLGWEKVSIATCPNQHRRKLHPLRRMKRIPASLGPIPKRETMKGTLKR